MANTEILTKRLAIDKANTQTVIIVAIASFVTIFCLVASQAVLSQNGYQSRVTTADDRAHQQLQKNIQAYNNLESSYVTFASKPTNIIGGQSSGTGNNGGNNAKIVLDALPGAYDFPGLTSTIEKILSDGSFNVTSITGTDDEVSQQSNGASANPQPISMPFTFTVSNTNYAAVGQLMNTLQNSIRPIQIDSINLTGGGSAMTLTVDAHTYYQPTKSLSITKQVVK